MRDVGFLCGADLLRIYARPATKTSELWGNWHKSTKSTALYFTDTRLVLHLNLYSLRQYHLALAQS